MLSVQFTLLLAALAGLLFGPVLLQIRRDVGPWQKALDGFTMVAVGGLAAFHLIPEAIEHGGFAALFFGGFGALLPLWSHHYAERLGGRGEILILMLGLIPHAALESAALGLADNTQALGLGIAVAAHRLPVGLLIFFLVRHRLGSKQAWIAIAILMLATLGGFVGGETFSTNLSGFGFAAFQALVAGSLLHVAFSHRLLNEGEHDAGCGHAALKTQNAQEEHHHDHTHSASAETIWAGLGALLGACVLIFTLSFGHQHAGPGQNGQYFTETLLSLSLKSAPALLLAYFLAGLIGILITPARAQWLAAGHQSLQALKGVAFGLPMPICSCGILPIYESLIKRGVPAVAAMGFLVATPELGIDAILISIPLLGQEMTLARLAAAFFVALGAALIVGPMVKNTAPCPTHTASSTPQTLKTRLKAGLKFGLVELFDHTMPWIIAGLLIAAWAEPLLAHPWLQQIPSSLQVPLFALMGIPAYVCASGATPIAAIAIYQGISPGAGLAFLLAGPATNMTTFGILSRIHTKKVALAFGMVVTLAAIAAGWIIDALHIGVEVNPGSHEHAAGSMLEWATLIALALLFIASLCRQGPRGIVGQIVSPHTT